MFDEWMKDGKTLRLQGCRSTWSGAMVWGWDEPGLRYVLAADHLQGPRKVCRSCCALGLWSLRARSEKDRNHHIARARLNSCRAPGLPPSVLGNIPSQLLLMGSVFLTDKHFSPWYKNSWTWHIVLISIKWQLQFTKGWCQVQTQTSLCNGSI